MRSLRKFLLVLFLMIVFILVLVAVTDNSSLVALTFLTYATPQWPIAWWILIAFLVGILFGYLMSLGSNVRSKVTALKSRRELEKTNTRLEQLQQG
jgi:putative membrane protein